MARIDLKTAVTLAALVLLAGRLPGQQFGGGTGLGGGMGGGGMGGMGGMGGSSFGGSGMGGSGGFGGSSFGGGSAFGGSGFGQGGFGSGGTGASSLSGFGGLGGTSRAGTSQYGSTSPFGRYYGNPLAAGLVTSRNTGTTAVGITVRDFPVPLVFGTTLYDAATLSRTPTTGMTALGGIGGVGAVSVSPVRVVGATSVGVRRAPGYLTEPVFDMPESRPSIETMRPELQDIISRSSRLPSRDRIRVTVRGDTVVLRGEVRDEREKRLAERILRLSPGVTKVDADKLSVAGKGSATR